MLGLGIEQPAVGAAEAIGLQRPLQVVRLQQHGEAGEGAFGDRRRGERGQRRPEMLLGLGRDRSRLRAARIAAIQSAAQARSRGIVDRRKRLERDGGVARLLGQRAAEIVPVAAHGERRRADRAAEVEGEDLSCRDSGGTAAPSAPAARDLPAPVGPTTSVWPTSPTWRENRNGVEPSVLRKEQRRGAEMLVAFRPRPDRRERDHVGEVERRDRRLADIGVDMAGQRCRARPRPR